VQQITIDMVVSETRSFGREHADEATLVQPAVNLGASVWIDGSLTIKGPRLMPGQRFKVTITPED
jgi:hypothetical protein